jgi:uncharacterized protein (DUF58 family)
VEFAEHSRYYPGDDIRNVDWKVFGRTDRYFIKRHEKEAQLSCLLMLDSSASMNYRGSRAKYSKHEFAKILLGAVGHILIRQDDAAGLCAFASEPLFHLPPKNNPGYLQILLEKMAGLSAASTGDTGFHSPFVNAAKQMSHTGMIIAATDLWGADTQTASDLTALSARGHDVVIFNILSPDELDFPFEGRVEFVDSEEGASVFCEPALLRRDYQNEIQRHIDGWKKICRRTGIEFVLAVTSEEPADTLAQFVINRSHTGVSL